MLRLSVMLALIAALVAAPTVTIAASQESDVMAAVNQFVDGFNRGDQRAATSACAAPASIVDDFPPHEWQGPTACADWYAAYLADAKKEGITDGVVKLGSPWHVMVTGSRAYVVAPATFTYKVHGKPTKEGNAVFTVALQKLGAGWRITGWAWSQH
ncbi:MAG TPA: nuclear transport factor 2 family protein [Candidatus Binatia bacterium]|nr:nuclear transport factor 2 family protein [Candidatus Binatia bacterium]